MSDPDYYEPVKKEIERYIDTNLTKFQNKTEITINDLRKYYTARPEPERPKTPISQLDNAPIRPTRGFLDPFLYFLKLIEANKWKLLGQKDENQNKIKVVIQDDTNQEIANIKKELKEYINENFTTNFNNLTQTNNNIHDKQDKFDFINNENVDIGTRSLIQYRVEYEKNSIASKPSFIDYVKNYEFHSRNELLYLVIYYIVNENTKSIDIANFVATLKAEIKDKRLEEKNVYRKIFIELLEEIDKEQQKQENNNTDIITIIKIVIYKRFPNEQSLTDSIQDSIAIYKMVKTIQESSKDGELSYSTLLTMLTSAAGLNEREKSLNKYFIGFLKYKKYTVTKNGSDIKYFNGPTEHTEAHTDFIKYHKNYEFHTKEELAPLIYLTITDKTDEIMPDIAAIFQRIETENNDNKTLLPTKELISIEKFINVLKEFKRYIDKNGVTFTNQNKENTIHMIEDFVNNLYPNYGSQQKLDDLSFYRSPTEFEKNEALESIVTAISPLRGQLALEIDKDRYAYNKLRKQIREIDANRDLKRRKLQEVARDLSTLAMLVPEKASRDYIMLNYANSSIQPAMLKLEEKLTPKQRAIQKREEKQEEDEQKHLDIITAEQRKQEAALVKRTAKEAENALKMIEDEKAKAAAAAGGAAIITGSFKEDMEQFGGIPLPGQPLQPEREPQEPREPQAPRQDELRQYDEKERENDEAEEVKETEKETEKEAEKEEEEKEEAKEDDLKGETNEDIKRIKKYQKAKEDLVKIREDISNAEDLIVRFKPYIDRYTIESPLTTLDIANKEYEEAKLKIDELKKKKQAKEKIFEFRKDEDFNKYYSEFYTIVKDIKEITSHFISGANTTKRNTYTFMKDTDRQVNQILIKKNTEDRTPDFEDLVNKLKTEKINIIEKQLNKLESSIYGDVKKNQDFQNFLFEKYETQAGSSESFRSVTIPTFKLIIQEIPSYKELIDQETAIKYEIEGKRNKASVVKTELQTTVNPVELQDQAGLLEESKKNIHEGVERIKEIINDVHIPQFKNTMKEGLKEVADGSTSVENLLQRLIDRTVKYMKDTQTRLASIHGIATTPDIAPTNTENREYREERRDRGFFGQITGGDKELKDTNDPQVLYKALTEKMVKLKDLVEQVSSFLERNTNTTAMLSTNGEPSIFVQLYNKYVEDRADPKKSMIEATEGLAASAKANRVAPGDVLKIDKFDKTVFVGLTLFLRLFALTLLEYLIDKRKVFTIEGALMTYLITYTGLFFLFVLIVNLDMYRMRIIFNYVNIHGGSMSILGHVIILWLFAMLLFIILRNIRFLNNPSGYNKAMTAEERAHLKNRMSVLTAVVWLFTTVMVIVS